LNVTCTDTLGEVGKASYTVRIDLTAPTISAPLSVTVNATGPSGATVTYNSSFADNKDGSGIASGAGCSPASGSTFAIGTTTVNCTAFDVVGNEATASFPVHVLGAADQLGNLYTQVQGVAPGNGLAAKIAAAQNGLARGNKSATCGPLALFITQVQAQSANIGTAAAAQLIAEAKQIEAVVGC
jgi:hypothetical protein